MVKKEDVVFELEAACFEEGKTYWVLVGDVDHEPTPAGIKRVTARLKRRLPKMQWIVSAYYIKPVSKRIKKKRVKK